MSDNSLDPVPYVDIRHLTPGECVSLLWVWLAYSCLIGTDSYKGLDREMREDFDTSISRGNLFALIEGIKRRALFLGVELSDGILGELSAATLVVGKPLPESDRNRLEKLARELYPVLCRLDADELWASPPATPKEAITPKVDREALAIALIANGMAMGDIAAQVGVGIRQLYRYPKFCILAEKLGVMKPRTKREWEIQGTKDKDGNIEAYRDTDDV